MASLWTWVVSSSCVIFLLTLIFKSLKICFIRKKEEISLFIHFCGYILSWHVVSVASTIICFWPLIGVLALKTSSRRALKYDLSSSVQHKYFGKSLLLKGLLSQSYKIMEVESLNSLCTFLQKKTQHFDGGVIRCFLVKICLQGWKIWFCYDCSKSNPFVLRVVFLYNTKNQVPFKN